jgi:hypothetical protein
MSKQVVQLPLFTDPGVFHASVKEGDKIALLEGKVFNMGDHYTAVIADWWLGSGKTKNEAQKAAVRAYIQETSA